MFKRMIDKMKPKIELNFKQMRKWDYEIRDLCKRYIAHEISFSIVLTKLKYRKIIKMEDLK